MNAPFSLRPGSVPLNLEAVGLDLALQSRQQADADFETLLAEAVAEFGGELLFHLRFEGEEAFSHVAAARLGDDIDRQLVLVTLPMDGGAPQVAPAETEDHPFGSFARSYAEIVGPPGTAEDAARPGTP